MSFSSQVKFARIANIAATTDVVAAPAAGSHIVVLSFSLSNGNVAATSANFRSGVAGTIHAGDYELAAAGGGFSFPGTSREVPVFECDTAATLRVTIDTAGPVGGHVTYMIVKD